MVSLLRGWGEERFFINRYILNPATPLFLNIIFLPLHMIRNCNCNCSNSIYSSPCAIIRCFAPPLSGFIYNTQPLRFLKDQDEQLWGYIRTQIMGPDHVEDLPPPAQVSDYVMENSKSVPCHFDPHFDNKIVHQNIAHLTAHLSRLYDCLIIKLMQEEKMEAENASDDKKPALTIEKVVKKDKVRTDI